MAANNITVDKFTYNTSISGNTITINTYGDGTFIRTDQFSSNIGLISSENIAKTNAEKFGIYSRDLVNFYKLKPPPPPPPTPETVPPPPPALPTPSPEIKKKGAWYLPKTRYRKPKSAAAGEFIVKATGKPYTGSYIETFKKKYYAGTSPEQLGEELQKIRQAGDFDLLGEAFNTLGPLLLSALKGGAVNREPTVSEVTQGEIKRYFVQDPVTSKIVEVTKLQYAEIKKKLPNKKFAEVPWKIQSPAEDVMVGGYLYQGAATQNREAILALEKQMPGITTVVRDYSYLVPPTPPKYINAPQTLITTVQDPSIELENRRKANFDTRK